VGPIEFVKSEIAKDKNCLHIEVDLTIGTYILVVEVDGEVQDCNLSSYGPQHVVHFVESKFEIPEIIRQSYMSLSKSKQCITKEMKINNLEKLKISQI
jgi:hypothetical protein